MSGQSADLDKCVTGCSYCYDVHEETSQTPSFLPPTPQFPETASPRCFLFQTNMRLKSCNMYPSQAGSFRLLMCCLPEWLCSLASPSSTGNGTAPSAHCMHPCAHALPALVLSVSWMLAILTGGADILLMFKSYADFIYFTFL